MGEEKMYNELAGWWPLVSPTEDYADEAAFFAGILRDAGAKKILELGSGGGNVAWHLKKEFDLTLTDLSAGMLAVSEEQNPGLEHIEADMRSIRLGRTFEGVLIHDAISYMTTEEDLRAAFSTAREHLETGGTLVIIPDCVAETFEPNTTSHEGTDEASGERGVRYLEWIWDPDPTDTVINYEVVLVLREGDELRTVTDRHKCGVFPRDTWLALLDEAGFEVETIADPTTDERSDVFVARKRNSVPG